MVSCNRSDETNDGITDKMFIAQVVSPNVSYTASLLGLIVMQAGVREETAKRGEEVERKHVEGVFSASKPFNRLADIVATIGHDMIHSGELAEMRDFRNHVFHGVNSVDPSSGTLMIRDGPSKNCVDSCKFYSGNTNAVYTVEELEIWTSMFLLLDPVLRDKYVSNFICLICGSGAGCDCNRVSRNKRNG